VLSKSTLCRHKGFDISRTLISPASVVMLVGDESMEYVKLRSATPTMLARLMESQTRQASCVAVGM
jgi:hypothetical protein